MTLEREAMIGVVSLNRLFWKRQTSRPAGNFGVRRLSEIETVWTRQTDREELSLELGNLVRRVSLVGNFCRGPVPVSLSDSRPQQAGALVTR